jgi:hypothetical protein
MISNDTMRILVFAKDRNEECFIPCELDVENKTFKKGNRTDRIYVKDIPEFTKSRELQKGLGSQMTSI